MYFAFDLGALSETKWHLYASHTRSEHLFGDLPKRIGLWAHNTEQDSQIFMRREANSELFTLLH